MRNCPFPHFLYLNRNLMPIPSIRIADTNDIATIQHLASLTWPVAYANILSPRQMSYMLDKMYSQANLYQQMTAEGHVFLIAMQDDQPVGFAGISPIDQHSYDLPPTTTVWKLHKLYVLPAIQKSGAGKALMKEVTATIKKAGGNYLILQVNRNNPAYDYYLKNGFEVLESADFDIGNGFFMNDYVMGKPLAGE